MAYHEGKIVIADRNLNQAVRNALSGNIEPERRNVERGRNSMSDGADAVGVENVGYNSYFKIVDRTETNEDGTKTFKIGVIDGGGRGSNRCKVNNKVFSIPAYEFTISTDNLIVIKFTVDSSNVSIELIGDMILPSDTAEFSYYQIGEVTIVNNKIEIHQDHLAGVAQLFWYDVCGE